MQEIHFHYCLGSCVFLMVLANSLLTCCSRWGFPYIGTQCEYHVSLMLFWFLFSFTIEVKKSISKKCHFINVSHKIFHPEYPSFLWKWGWGGAYGGLIGHIILDNIILESKRQYAKWNLNVCLLAYKLAEVKIIQKFRKE